MAVMVSPALADGEPRTVKVGTTSKLVLDNLPMFVGMHMKFFEEVGIKLDPVYLRGGGETVRAMTTRSVEFNASAATVPVLIAIDKGEPIKIVSSQVGGMVGEARTLFRGDDYVKEYQQAVVPVMEETLKKDPELIRNFLRARAKAVRFIKENPERTIAIWAEELELPIEAIRMAYKDLNPDAFEVGAPRTENLRGALQETLDVGAIKQPLDLAKTLDLRFLPR